jgi:hypothetical protein
MLASNTKNSPFLIGLQLGSACTALPCANLKVHRHSSTSPRGSVLWWRKLNSKAKFESGSSYFSFNH